MLRLAGRIPTFAILLAAITVLACGGPSTPSAPPTPPPPVYPNMVGGWGGSWAQVFTTGAGAGDTTCSAIWLIGTQSAGSFSGRIN
jgi:hypothetical protein